jgi:hypothetical protein
MAKKQEKTVVVTGLVHVTGPPGGGKTMFAITAAKPENTAFLDGDASKSKGLCHDLGVKKYVDLTLACQGQTEVEQFETLLKTVEDLPSGLDLIVWDEPIAQMLGAHSYVTLNRPKFRELWNSMGPIAGGQAWKQTRKVLFPRLYSLLLSKAKLVIICTHQKAERDAKQVLTGSMIPDVDPSLNVDAGLVIRIGPNTRNADTQIPSGLVLKNTGYVDKATMTPVAVLPLRLPKCTWPAIAEYVLNPISKREELLEEEKPDEFEYHLIQGTLNPEQVRVYKLARALQAMAAEQEEGEAIMESVFLLRTDNKDMAPPLLANKILTELAPSYPDLTHEKVMGMLVELSGKELSEKEE